MLISFVILSLIGIILPCLKIIGYYYYLSIVFILLLLFILSILLLKIEIKYKVIILLTLFLVYKNTFAIVGNVFYSLFTLVYIDSVDDRKNNKHLISIVKPIYMKYFNFVTNFEKLPDKPSIIVCNYCDDRVENLCCILLPKDLAIMMRDELKNIMKFGKILKWTIETKETGSFENTKKQIKEHINKNRYIFTYVTNNKKYKFNYISKIRSGVFHIAKELNIPITLLAIDYIDTKFGTIPYQNFRIHVGDTFYVEEPKNSIYKCKKFFKNTLTEFMNTKYNFN